MKQLVLASNNPGKARELHRLLEPLGLEVLPQAAFDVPPIDEPYPGFVENALHKARHAARHSGLPALADDSGLCVAALGFEPGVHSARFAGEPKSDARNNALLLERLAGVTDRSAYFYCVLVLVRSATDPRPLLADGEWHGEILQAPRGQAGFGYDPLFLVPNLGQTAAELDEGLKNTLSHRGAAMRHMLERLQVHPL
jgi:XTP/dITP diphosphohydrolase